LATGVKFKVNVKKEPDDVVSVFFNSSSLRYNNGIQLAKFGLLIDRTSSINLKVRLKCLWFRA